MCIQLSKKIFACVYNYLKNICVGIQLSKNIYICIQLSKKILYMCTIIFKIFACVYNYLKKYLYTFTTI